MKLSIEDRIKRIEDFLSTLDAKQLPENMSNDHFSIILSEPKKIDMSVCIESGIDCEFNDHSFSMTPHNIGGLRVISTDDKPYHAESFSFRHCRPRFNHIHAVDGAFNKQPLPDGFEVMVFFVNGEVYQGEPREFDWDKINRFKMLKMLDGFVV